MINNFAIQIEFNDEYVNENNQIAYEPKVLILDAVTEPITNSSNTLPTHPIVSGDMITDHSYKNPLNMSFNAAVALRGHTGAILNDVSVTPAKIIEILNLVKSRAYLCKIVKINTSNEKDIRFTQYDNMVISSLQITEYINSILASISWQQVMLADVQLETQDATDEYLPNINIPSTTSLTDFNLITEDITLALIQALLDEDLLDAELLKEANVVLANAAVGLIAGLAVGYAVGSIVTSVLAACSVAGPYGWIAGGIVAGVIVLGSVVIGVVKAIKRNIKFNSIKKFTYYKNDAKKTEEETKRFIEFLAKFIEQFESLNNYVSIYQISSNSEQELMINISNYYYIFTFTKNNTTNDYRCDIKDASTNAYVGGISSISACPVSFTDCTINDDLITTADRYTFIVKPENTNKLTDCYIITSSIKPEDFTNLISDILMNYLVG